MRATEDRPANILIVVAHPDDEVLGCGAAGAALVARGHSVRACILSGDVQARTQRPTTDALIKDTLNAQRKLGFGEPILGAFPNVALNTVSHLELVKFIERALGETGATTVFTHHPRDVNNDHLHVSLACQAAIRLPRRRDGFRAMQNLLFMETLSSTDWSVPDGRAGFDPDTFFPVSESMIDLKLEALACYRNVMRPQPHSRSIEVLRALATVRGAQCGALHAEAFQTGYRLFE